MSDYNLRAIISVVDRLSPALKEQAKNLNKLKRQFSSFGSGALPMAAGLAGAMALPARAFMEAEDAATQLKTTMMTSDGLAPGFKELMKIATDLGNTLPGTTADFAHMGTVMKANGIHTETMINGGLKASAYLAVATKGLGESYDSAALGVAKISNVFSVADSDLVSLADTMQRVVNIGVGIEPFTSAMSKAGGALKGLKVQGLNVANQMAPLVAMLVQSGVDPSEAGTGLKELISTAAKAGKFTSITNLVADLEKMNKLQPAKLFQKFEKLFGKEHATKAMTIAGGGYAKMAEEMKKQADLNLRVAESLKSLTNLWDAATGTFTGAMVAFSTAYAPEMKQLAQSINDVSGSLITWATSNGPAIRTGIEMAAGFVGLKLAAVGVAFGIGLISKAMIANPIGLLVQMVALAAPMIINNWGLITSTLTSGWTNAVNGVLNVWKGVVDGIMQGVNAVKDALNSLLSVFGDFKIPDITLPDIKLPSLSQLGSKLGGMVFDMNMTKAQGMRSPGFQKNIADTGKAAGAIKMPNLTDLAALSDGMRSPGYQNNIVDFSKAAGAIKMPNLTDLAALSDGMRSPGYQNNIVDFSKAVGAIKMPNLSDLAAPSDNSQLSLVRQDRGSILRANNGAVDVNVSFNNAPSTMRVEPAKTRGPVRSSVDVGYRFAHGMGAGL